MAKFIKRKKISSSVVNVLHKKCEIRQFHVVVSVVVLPFREFKVVEHSFAGSQR